MTDLYDRFGLELKKRVEYLINNLTNDESKQFPRLQSFVNIWANSIGGSFDTNEHTHFFSNTNMYALRQIDSVFFKKYRLHIVESPMMIEATDSEWNNGI